MPDVLEKTIEKNQTSSSEKQLIRLLEKNLAKNEEILLLTKQIRKYIKRQIIWSFFRLIIVLTPIILGIIYLPPVIKEFIQKISLFWQNFPG